LSRKKKNLITPSSSTSTVDTTATNTAEVDDSDTCDVAAKIDAS